MGLLISGKSNSRAGVMPDYTYITHVNRTFIKLLAEQSRQKKVK